MCILKFVAWIRWKQGSLIRVHVEVGMLVTAIMLHCKLLCIHSNLCFLELHFWSHQMLFQVIRLVCVFVQKGEIIFVLCKGAYPFNHTLNQVIFPCGSTHTDLLHECNPLHYRTLLNIGSNHRQTRFKSPNPVVTSPNLLIAIFCVLFIHRFRSVCKK